MLIKCLLKDESSPTMPGNMLGLLEKIGKGKGYNILDYGINL